MSAAATPAPFTIRVAATFTADPLRAPFADVLATAGIDAAIEFADYSQLFQELIGLDSALAKNHHGVNVLLVRLEDWSGLEQHALDVLPRASKERQQIERNAGDFLMALQASAARCPAPFLVCLCPESASLCGDADSRGFLEGVEGQLSAGVRELANGAFLTAHDVCGMYPVETIDDPASNRIGHVPYTPEYFAAASLAIARRVYRFRTPPPKVIVLDLDGTLWTGVAGEDGPHGVVVDEGRLFLQRFMLAQQQAGALLCICSKNNEDDAWAVFRERTDLVLRPEHFVTHRINWNHKSLNIESMAAELNVGVDSMMLVDDDPAVCAEVRHACPDVAVVPLPRDSAEIRPLLERLWLFDRPKATAEDERRTALYRANADREQLRHSATDVEAFLAGLGLEIAITPMRPEQHARVSQLTLRTNQFNTTTIRRSEAELAAALRSGGLECQVTEVKDRFGDYGLVGVTLHRIAGESLLVDSFMMSCRVLGRGVEQRMLARLGAIARAQNLRQVDVRFVRSAKNRPALDFLQSIACASVVEEADAQLFRLPADQAAALDTLPVHADRVRDTVESSEPSAISRSTDSRVAVDALLHVASAYATPAALVEKVHALRRPAAWRSVPFAAPRTETERALTQIWEQLLGVTGVGIHETFFDLGGDSLLAVGMFAEIERQLDVDLGVAALLESPTIARLAATIDRKDAPAWSCLVPIQPLGTMPALYCMHAAGGNVLFYKDLARHLGSDQPLYGLQAQGLSKIMPWHRTVEDMAECYLKAIRKHQPEGPYFLAGSSFGGLIAYEMARQLERAGEDIALLALLDTYGPRYPQYPRHVGAGRKRFYRFVARVATHQQNLALLPWSGRYDYVLDRIQRAKRTTWRKWRRVKNEVAANYEQMMGREIPARLMQTQNAILEALAAYRYPSYAGTITLFRATSQPVGAVPDRELGWRACATGSIEVHEVAGHHGAVTVDPHATFLAKKLAACLAGASRRPLTMAAS